jgi:hypothetical protein
MNREGIDILKNIGIRGRVAVALLTIERALDGHHVHDPRVRDLVAILWRFVEPGNRLEDVDHAWRQTEIAKDLLDPVDRGDPIPPEYADLPEFIAKALYHALWIGLSEMYGSIRDFGPESLDHTIHVLRLCQSQGVELPDIKPIAQVRFDEQFGWGHPRPRAFFAT